jgi:hypothetical protein
MNLAEVASDIEQRLLRIFVPDAQGRRASHGADTKYAEHDNWRELVLFYEYFHGDTGRGLGASHQTGWTALVATMLQNQASLRSGEQTRC